TPASRPPTSPPRADSHHPASVRLIRGLGGAFFSMPPRATLPPAPPPDQIAAGPGLAPSLRPPGGSFAASLTTWIWNRRATQHHAYLSENISLYDPATHETLAQLGGNTQANAALLDRMVQSQAYMMS
ncbi:hypothetical protein QMO31_32995, partial [Pseudomonas aeruginosa]|nr:hypothetical protein [Pseudomonas aeruginosa]